LDKQSGGPDDDREPIGAQPLIRLHVMPIAGDAAAQASTWSAKEAKCPKAVCHCQDCLCAHPTGQTTTAPRMTDPGIGMTPAPADVSHILRITSSGISGLTIFSVAPSGGVNSDIKARLAAMAFWWPQC